MRTIVKGKHLEIPDRVRRYAERKLGRLQRYLDDRSDATVELSVERHRSDGDSHIVDLTLVIDGQTLRSSAAAASHTAGIDEVVDKIERRAVDFREKPRARARMAGAGTDGGDASVATPLPDEAPDTRQIVKVKRFAIEPMFEEDALARMEELGHAFFVFVDAETERVAILYRRRDGDFGVIEPVVGGDYTTGGVTGRSRSGASGAPLERR
ncbi:MAG: ribosome-associated translation inhibitor RaiA [Chloroflexota bacterium]